MKKTIARVGAEKAVMGRPREFDTDAALEKAMRLFWAKGYEGTSVAELTEALASAGPVCMPHSGTNSPCFAPL